MLNAGTTSASTCASSRVLPAAARCSGLTGPVRAKRAASAPPPPAAAPGPGLARPARPAPCRPLPAIAAAAASSSSSATPAAAEQGPSGGGAGEGPPPVRRMILLRHADSEASPSTRDHERPISSHGQREAMSIAKRLREMGWAPDLIIASNSRRTKMTLDVMAEADDALSEVDAHYLGSLYTVAALDGQTRSHLEECIRSVASDTANFCVMCVGHNKGWEEAASSFARRAVRLHTASAALFEAAGRTWQDATAPEVEWRLVQVLTP